MNWNAKLLVAAWTVAVLAAVLLGGCAGDFKGRLYEKPGQATAGKLVWNDVLGMAGDVPFEVLWVEGDDLDCPDKRTWRTEDGTCADGQLNWKPRVMQVAWVPGATFAGSAWSHELGHGADHTTGGSGDAEHRGKMFCDPGEVGPCEDWPLDHGEVGKGNQALKAANL